jgi:hypothetical protein
MATIFDIAKAMWNKRKAKAQETERKANPLDLGLSLGLRIESKISINPILPESGLLTEFSTGEYVVIGFSKTTVVGSTCYRIQLSSEAGGEDEPPMYLWIFQDAKGVLIRWFKNVDTVTPETPSDWDFWLSEKDGNIGLSTFQANDDKKTMYHRAWEKGSETRIPPVEYRETLHFDRYDSTDVEQISHQAMLYSRKVEDEILPREEHILISSTKCDGQSRITVDVGVDLDATDIKQVY